MPLPQEPELFYTLHEVAHHLRCNVRTIYRMVDSREIRATRVRNRWMVLQKDFALYIEQQRTNLR